MNNENQVAPESGNTEQKIKNKIELNWINCALSKYFLSNSKSFKEYTSTFIFRPVVKKNALPGWCHECILKKRAFVRME